LFRIAEMEGGGGLTPRGLEDQSSILKEKKSKPGKGEEKGIEYVREKAGRGKKQRIVKC